MPRKAFAERKTGQPSKGRRRGDVFSVRVTADERAELECWQKQGGGPRSLGRWLVWRALSIRGRAFDSWKGTTRSSGYYPSSGSTGAARVVPPPAERVILDLCAGTGAWSEPYFRAGYDVRCVELEVSAASFPYDVRTYVPPPNVWGVLAAPPCTEFSIARNGHPDLERDFVEGMACVNACMRIILQCKPRWWALENPTGKLGEFLGTPRDVFEPCDFGDPWTKRTALWGDFVLPVRGPFVEPTSSAMDRASARERARTPPGFARAFFDANP